MNKPTTCVLGLYTPLVDDPRIAADALAFWTIAKTEGTVASLETNAGIMADALGTPVAQPGLEAMARLPIEALHAHSVRLARMWAVRPQVREYSFDLWVHDFEAVIDAAGFPRVSLLGTCQSGPIAIEYAARHPERVAKLVLSRDGADGREAKILLDMLRLGWGDENHAYLQVWAKLFQPGGSIEHLRVWSEMQRQSTSAEAAQRLFDVTFNVQVEASARRVRCPTLLISAVPPFLARFCEKMCAVKSDGSRCVETGDGSL